MKIYFASGFFNEAQEDLRIKATEQLNKNNTVDAVFYPFDHQEDSGLELGTDNWADMQFKIDEEQLKSADVVVVALTADNPDSGTAWEMGAAYAWGKPIVYVSDKNNGNLMTVMSGTYNTLDPSELATIDFQMLPTNKWSGKYI